jgi:hypothetical protein
MDRYLLLLVIGFSLLVVDYSGRRNGV